MDDQVFTTEELNKGTVNGTIQPNLPPAGYKREEELAIREDNLQEKAETISPDKEAVNPEAFKPDREIQGMIRKDFLSIGVDHPVYKTKWVNYINQHGTKVWEAKADGWQVSNVKDFPDAVHLRKEDNTIRVGDVILMHLRMDEYVLLMEREKTKRLRQQYGVEAEIHEIAAKHPDIFPKVHTESSGGLPPNIQKRVESSAINAAAMRKAAKSTARHTLGNKLAQGDTIPGVPIK
jgi:hypothetical protein